MDVSHDARLVEQLIRHYSPRAANILTLLQTKHSDYVAYRAGSHLLYLKSILHRTLLDEHQLRPPVLTENPVISALVDEAAAYLTEDLRTLP